MQAFHQPPVKLHASVAGRRAFTLIELLVVLAIIGALAALSLPALKGFGQSNVLAAAERQMLDDLGLARQYAIKNRATVYMVFAMPLRPAGGSGDPFADAAVEIQLHKQKLESMTHPALDTAQVQAIRARALQGLTNTVEGLYTAYALYTEQSVGEQPGVVRPRYLTEWRNLPDGVVFPTNLVLQLPVGRFPEVVQRVQALPARPFQFPITTGLGEPTDMIPELTLPYVAFDATGRLLAENGTIQDRFLAVGLGSVLVPHAAATGAGGRKNPGPVDFSRPVDYLETPRSNHTNSLYRVTALTGRAKLYKPESQ